MTSSARYWNPIEVLEIEDLFTCVGHAPSKGRKCQNPIAAPNRQWGSKILSNMSQCDPSTTDMKSHLQELAPAILCQRNHQGQAQVMIDRWRGRIARLRIRASEPAVEDGVSEFRPFPTRRIAAEFPIFEPQIFVAPRIRTTTSETIPARTSTRVSSSRTIAQTSTLAIEARPIAPLRAHSRRISARATVPSVQPTDLQDQPANDPQSQVHDVRDRGDTSSNVAITPIPEAVPILETAIVSESRPSGETDEEASVAVEPVSEPVSEPALEPNAEIEPETAPEAAVEQESPPRPVSPAPTVDASTEQQAHHPESSSSNVEECSICYEDISTNVGISAHCGHSFHAGCINTWFDASESPAGARTCPYCRSHWRRQDIEGLCTICQDTLHDDNETDAIASNRLVWCKSSCGHNFHLECMDSWLAASDLDYNVGTCPDCRAEWVA